MTLFSLRFSPRFALLFAALAVLFGAAQTQLWAASPATVRGFDPVAFFSGSTEGNGSLKQVFSSAQTTHVTGVGKMQADGYLVIDQIVKIEGETMKNRQWRLHETKPGSFSGTLSDAKGPVAAVVSGNQLRIRYKMPDGLSVSQVLTIAQDGKSARNAMKIRKFGIVVATLDETIRRI